MVDDTSLGKRLRRLRTARAMSLSEEAVRVGVTPSFLSQLERGLVAPSVATLLRLADVLDVSVGDLFPPPSSSRVVEPGQRRTVRFEGLTEGLITTPDAQILGAAICTFQPNSDSGQMEHRSLEELLFVVKGELHVILDEETVRLSEGAAFTYDCRVPHILRNPSPRESVVLMCHAPRPNAAAALQDHQAFTNRHRIKGGAAHIRTRQTA